MSEEKEQKDELDIRTLYGPSDLDGKLLHVKVGHPSGDDKLLQHEVDRIKSLVTETMDDFGINCQVLVTHAYVDIEVIESNSFSEKEGG